MTHNIIDILSSQELFPSGTNYHLATSLTTQSLTDFKHQLYNLLL